jgi:hypothetical protein
MIVEHLKERKAEDARLALNNQRREKCVKIFHRGLHSMALHQAYSYAQPHCWC